MDNAELIAQYREESKKQKMPLDGTCLDRLHADCLKGGNRDAAKRVVDGIRMTKALGVEVMLLPFFGKCATEPADFDSTADLLRELAPEAEKAGVILGLENTLSAEDNVRIMDKVKSKAVKVYYDVGNSTHWKHDVLQEIPWLGKDRICQIHLKDEGYLARSDRFSQSHGSNSRHWLRRVREPRNQRALEGDRGRHAEEPGIRSQPAGASRVRIVREYAPYSGRCCPVARLNSGADADFGVRSL